MILHIRRADLTSTSPQPRLDRTLTWPGRGPPGPALSNTSGAPTAPARRPAPAGQGESWCLGVVLPERKAYKGRVEESIAP